MLGLIVVFCHVRTTFHFFFLTALLERSLKLPIVFFVCPDCFIEIFLGHTGTVHTLILRHFFNKPRLSSTIIRVVLCIRIHIGFVFSSYADTYSEYGSGTKQLKIWRKGWTD